MDIVLLIWQTKHCIGFAKTRVNRLVTKFFTSQSVMWRGGKSILLGSTGGLRWTLLWPQHAQRYCILSETYNPKTIGFSTCSYRYMHTQKHTHTCIHINIRCSKSFASPADLSRNASMVFTALPETTDVAFYTTNQLALVWKIHFPD